MSIHSMLLSCYSCGANVPRAAVRCPWCSVPMDSFSGGRRFGEARLRQQSARELGERAKRQDVLEERS